MSLQIMLLKQAQPILSRIENSEPSLKPFVEGMREQIIRGSAQEPLDYEEIAKAVVRAYIGGVIRIKAVKVERELIQAHSELGLVLSETDIAEYQEIGNAFRRISERLPYYVLGKV